MIMFPDKLHKILSDPSFKSIITWNSNGTVWKILNPKRLEEEVIPLYFRHRSLASFMRQVNGWGFQRLSHGLAGNSYYHEFFCKEFPHLCKRIRRSKVAKPQSFGLKSSELSAAQKSSNEREIQRRDVIVTSNNNPVITSRQNSSTGRNSTCADIVKRVETLILNQHMIESYRNNMVQQIPSSILNQANHCLGHMTTSNIRNTEAEPYRPLTPQQDLTEIQINNHRQQLALLLQLERQRALGTSHQNPLRYESNNIPSISSLDDPLFQLEQQIRVLQARMLSSRDRL